MALVHSRISSNTASVVAASTAQNAVDALLAGTPTGFTVTTVTNPFPLWPQILRFNGDNVGANPQTIWVSPGTATPGQSIGFAAAAPPILLTAGSILNDLKVNMTVFADNAVEARIQAYTVVNLPLLPTLIPTTNLNVPLTDGTITDPNAQNTPTPPFGWQNVRYYSTEALPGAFVALGLQIVFSFQVLNYNDNGPANPAGLSFIADVYGDVITIG
jgi:hypothetical protein